MKNVAQQITDLKQVSLATQDLPAPGHNPNGVKSSSFGSNFAED